MKLPFNSMAMALGGLFVHHWREGCSLSVSYVSLEVMSSHLDFALSYLSRLIAHQCLLKPVTYVTIRETVCLQ